MRKFSHFLKLGLFVTIVAAFYAAIFLLVLVRASDVTLPVAVSLISSGIAVVTGLLAIVKDGILDRINRPRLAFSFFPYDRRDCHTTEFRDTQTGALKAKVHYFRVRVENNGWRAAEEVEVNLEQVARLYEKTFRIEPDFMPLRFFWSHWKQLRLEISIPPGTYRHCDFGLILEPKQPPQAINNMTSEENGNLLFWLDLIFRPNTGRTSLLPGRYQVTISAFGKNVGRVTKTLEFDWLGTWYDDIDQLLENSLKMRKGFKRGR